MSFRTSTLFCIFGFCLGFTKVFAFSSKPLKLSSEAAYSKWRKDNPIPRGSVETLVDHIEHIVKVAGIDAVGLGSDYDGVPVLPDNLEDVSTYPYITQVLLERVIKPKIFTRFLEETLYEYLKPQNR